MFRARGCTPEESADLAQDAAVRAFVHIRRWGVTGAGLDPLLNRIARNLLIDRYRRTTPHIVPLDDAGELQDPTQDPTEEVDRRQRRRAVHSAISALPTRHRAAITYSLNGLSPEEVGRQMGIGRNAADALLHRARRSLREHLTTAGEGMFGFALGIRVRWDRVVRRLGVQSGMSDISTLAAANSAVGAATAALIAVLSVAGGGAASTPRTASAAFLAARSDRAAVVAPSLSNAAQPPAIGGSGSGGGSVWSGRFGPARTSWNSDGSVDNQVGVPDPHDPSGPPLLDVTNKIWQNNGPRQPISKPHVTPRPLICGETGLAC
jgi:RNA polymerase sigma-70 factor (ECF subfamily)